MSFSSTKSKSQTQVLLVQSYLINIYLPPSQIQIVFLLKILNIAVSKFSHSRSSPIVLDELIWVTFEEFPQLCP